MFSAKFLLTGMPAVIIDNGSGSCKAGITGELEPRSKVISCVGHPNKKMEERYFGGKALAKKGSLALNYPIERGIVTHWDDMERLWRYLYKYELKVEASERPVLLSEPPLNPLRKREIMTELMFEHLRVPALYLANQATLALYTSARTTGLVIDSGDGVTHAVPICDGCCLPHGVSKLNIAGSDITKYLTRLLLDKSLLSVSRATETKVKAIKEKYCYVAFDPEEELVKKMERVLKLSDGNTVKINFHFCKAPEILFAPKTIGVEAPGLHTMITDSIKKCDKDICHQLYENLVLAGGSSLFQGMDERIFKEIEPEVPNKVSVRIIAPPERSCASWLGGSIITSLDSFAPMWVTPEDYEEFGGAVVHRKCF